MHAGHCTVHSLGRASLETGWRVGPLGEVLGGFLEEVMLTQSFLSSSPSSCCQGASLAGARLPLWLLSHLSLLAGPSQPHRFADLLGLLPLAGKPLINSVGGVPPGLPALGCCASRSGRCEKRGVSEGQEGSWAVPNPLWAPHRDHLRGAACPGLGVLGPGCGTVLGCQVSEPRAAGRVPRPLRGRLGGGQPCASAFSSGRRGDTASLL